MWPVAFVSFSSQLAEAAACIKTGWYHITSKSCEETHVYIKLDHRIIGWKRPLRSSGPTIHPTPPCLLNHVPNCHIYTFSKHFQGWGLHHLPRMPIPMSDHSFSKGIFPNIQYNPPQTQLEVIASHPIASHLGGETNTHLTTTSFREL